MQRFAGRGWSTTRKVIAIGRNYAEHAKELGNAVPKKPMFFLKPPSSIITAERPRHVKSLHHEVELAVVIGKTGRDISLAKAMDYVAGYTVGIDMTARDIQDEAKKAGAPWTEAKGYDTFTPLGEFKPKEEVGDISNLRIWLKVDGELRQDGNTRDMIFSVPTLISTISQVMTLETGDVILTGTPSGVGEVKPGQKITAGIEKIGEVEFEVIERPAPKL